MRVSLSDLSSLRKKYVKKQIVFAGGTFDIFHSGHVDFLKMLSGRGDIVVIGISSDKRVRERKGPSRPLQKQNDRLKVVDSCKYVTYTLVLPEFVLDRIVPTTHVIKILHPDEFVTRDFRKWKPYEKQIIGLGVKIHYDKLQKRTSTSRIIRSINDFNE